jgi:hypothetical protein
MSKRPFTAKQIDAILLFIDRFEAAGFLPGTCHSLPGEMPCYEYDEVVVEFQKSLYDNGWVRPEFDWSGWQQIAEEFVSSPKKIETANATTIQRLFTTHVRKERICEGHLASMFENGHVLALLKRLRTIRNKMRE